jgi:hypothetical protein
MDVLGPLAMPPFWSRQNTNKVKTPPRGNVYSRLTVEPFTVMAPISSLSTYSLQLWMPPLALTVADKVVDAFAVTPDG